MRRREVILDRVMPTTLFFAYIFLLLYLTVIKRLIFGMTSGMFLENYKLNISAYSKFNVNLVPFKTVYLYLVHAPSLKVALTNLVGNLLAFLPLGLLLPIVFRKLSSTRKILLISIASSVLIELLQLMLRVGSTDIDDVLLNTLGSLIGYWLYQKAIARFRKFKRAKGYC